MPCVWGGISCNAPVCRSLVLSCCLVCPFMLPLPLLSSSSSSSQSLAFLSASRLLFTSGILSPGFASAFPSCPRPRSFALLHLHSYLSETALCHRGWLDRYKHEDNGRVCSAVCRRGNPVLGGTTRSSGVLLGLLLHGRAGRLATSPKSKQPFRVFLTVSISRELCRFMAFVSRHRGAPLHPTSSLKYRLLLLQRV